MSLKTKNHFVAEVTFKEKLVCNIKFIPPLFSEANISIVVNFYLWHTEVNQEILSKVYLKIGDQKIYYRKKL